MIKIKKAKLGHSEKIVKLILEGAQKGSFDPRIQKDSMRVYLEKDIESIIVNERRTDDNLKAWASAFQDKDKFVGFVIISDMPPQLPGRELYGYYLIPSYRGRGYGKQLLQKIMENVRAECRDFYVRCRPESTVMYHLVEKAGFRNIGTNETGVHIMHKVLEEKHQTLS